MAGMFYSLQEAAEKLNKTENQVEELVKEGRLREFRDGSNVLFKIDEVEALLADTSFNQPAQDVSAKPQEAVPPEVPAEQEKTAQPEISEVAEKPKSSAESEETDLAVADEDIALAPEAIAKAENKENIEIPDDTITADDELTDADTILADEGIGLLGETDTGKTTEDTMGETQLTGDLEGTTAGAEASLEEIEEDVNLDTFGSGSGLLDLSLQADDTSLGGILDEIYTSQGDEGLASGAGASALDVAAETEQMLAEVAQPGMEAPAAIIRPQFEPAPDMMSNTLGYILFLPILAIVYTAIVIVAGQIGVTPAIFTTIQDIKPGGIPLIWYIMIGFAVVALLMAAVPLMSAGQATKKPKRPKPPKAKKPKEKKTKEKKPKEKKPKEKKQKKTK